jgi:hypothetical protein
MSYKNTELDTSFWMDAFDTGAPFYDNYVKSFRRGVEERIPGLLDLHREALYYIKDSALASIIPKIISVAAEYPDSGFVESLTFFLSRREQKERLVNAAKSGWISSKSFADDIAALRKSLKAGGDDDLAEQIEVFQNILGLSK